jgi:hypothetical protein
MARDDEQDERDRNDPPKRPGRSKWMDDEDDRPRKKGSLLWLWLLLGIGGGVLLVCGGGGALMITMWARAGSPGPLDGMDGPAVKKTWTREEFKAAVMGKTEAEVVAAVGKPDTTLDDGGGKIMWRYLSLTVDPVTGKTDYAANVWFKGGRVETVRY